MKNLYVMDMENQEIKTVSLDTQVSDRMIKLGKYDSRFIIESHTNEVLGSEINIYLPFTGGMVDNKKPIIISKKKGELEVDLIFLEYSVELLIHTLMTVLFGKHKVEKRIDYPFFDKELMSRMAIINITNPTLGSGIDYLSFIDFRKYKYRRNLDEWVKNKNCNILNKSEIRKRLGIFYDSEFQKFLTIQTKHSLITGIYDECPFISANTEELPFNNKWRKFNNFMIFSKKGSQITIVVEFKNSFITVTVPSIVIMMMGKEKLFSIIEEVVQKECDEKCNKDCNRNICCTEQLTQRILNY